ncbi:MAG: DNA polymerase III subunit delta' [Chloroflexota bacterium]
MMTARNHNWHVWGHDYAVEFLQRSITNQRNRHAYLITGTPGIGKNKLAHAFAMALNCTHDDLGVRPCGECRSCKLIYSGNHPDLLYTDRDERTGRLKIDTLRDLMKLLALKPFNSRYRVAILEGFDRADPRAQDAMLKTIEEPPPHAVLLLMAESTENIMPTIISRCQIVALRPVPPEQIKAYLQMHGADEERAELLARLSSGRIEWALEALKNEVIMEERDDMLKMLNEVVYSKRVKRFEIAGELEKVARKDNDAIRYLLETWQTYWRDVLLMAEGSAVKPCNSDRRVEMQQLVQTIRAEDALRALQATRTLLNTTLKTNANMRMAFEVLFLDYPGLS